MAADFEPMHLLATRYSELIRSRLQSDLVSEMCRTLLEPWPNRDSSGVRASTTRLTDCAERSEYRTPPAAGGTKEGGCKGECPLEGGHKGTDPLNRGSVGEFPLASRSSPDRAIDMDGLEEILTKARKVREMQIKLERKQSKGKEDPLKPVKGETSKTTVKKSIQKASQVYSQQSERMKPRSAAVQSVPRSSQSRVQSSKKTPGSAHLKSRSCYSQLHSVKKISGGLSDACQRRTQSSAPVGGTGMEGGAGGNKKGRTRPEWRSVVPDSLVRSEVDEVPCVSHLPQGKSSQGPACKDTGPPEKEDKMKGHFRISECGRNIDMPLKYHRLKEAAARVTAELDALQSTSLYEEGFIAKLSQLEDMDHLCTSNADLYVQLLLFRENCHTLQAQIAQYIPKKVTEESQRGQKHLPSPDRESVRLRFEELEKQWAKLSKRGCTSSEQWRSAPWDSRVSRQHCQQPKPLIYTTEKEWLEYSQLKNKVAQLEWEAKFLKACLTVIPPKLNHSTSDRSHIHAIQSVYHLFGITQPSFVVMPDSST